MVRRITSNINSYSVRSPLLLSYGTYSKPGGASKNEWLKLIIKNIHLCLHHIEGAACKCFGFDLYQLFLLTYNTAKQTSSSWFFALLVPHTTGIAPCSCFWGFQFVCLVQGMVWCTESMPSELRLMSDSQILGRRMMLWKTKSSNFVVLLNLVF